MRTVASAGRAALCAAALLTAGFSLAGSPAVAERLAADKFQVAGELSTRSVRTEESALANLIADAVMKSAGTDAAFLAASSFSDVTLPKGSATTDDVLKALAFRSDTIVIVKLTGAQIKQALAHGLSLYPQRHSAFLQVAGISAEVDPAADGVKRVSAVRVGGSAAQDKKQYTVAMPSPLANGALAFYKVWTKADIDRDTGVTLEDAVKTYLSGRKTIGDKSEERLVFKK